MALYYLAAAGVGRLGIVGLSSPGQLSNFSATDSLYTSADLGNNKVDIAALRLAALIRQSGTDKTSGK